MIYNFAFIVTDGVEFIDDSGNLTRDRKRAHRFPYQGEAKRAAAKLGTSYKTREIE
jgi:hypothetical protein